MVRRRKFIIIQAVAAVSLAAFLFSLQQERLYQASAEVLLSHQNLAAALTNTQDPGAAVQAERLAETQANLARVSRVAARTLRAARSSERPRDFLAASSVSAKENADLLVFTVKSRNSARASRLATEYARQFTIYRRQLDTGALKRARAEVNERLALLEVDGDRGSPLYASLVEKEQQLGTMEALQTSNAHLVEAAGAAEQVQPRPVRNVSLALALGLFLGIGLAFLWEALDTRVRSADEIAERLHVPLLARVPEPPKRVRAAGRLTMLAEPEGPHAEAYRLLRTNLEFVNLERCARTIMVTSALEAEGKSTTAANLALALARAGKRVVLVDLDLRRPLLASFFDLSGRPGLTEVALGHATLADALAPVAFSEAGTAGHAAGGNGSGRFEGVVEVLGCGMVPPDPGEFVGTRAVAEILDQLADRSDLVLIDSPPLLHVGDAVTLAARVDAIVLVTHLDVARRHLLGELRRVLETLPCPTLGFVVAGAELERNYGYAAYGRSYAYVPSERQPVA